MSATISSINIKNVSFAITDEVNKKCEISIDFDVEYNAGAIGDDKFYLLWYEAESSSELPTFKTHYELSGNTKIPGGESLIHFRKYKAENAEYNPSKITTVKVCKSAQDKDAENYYSVPIVCETFKNISGVYNGENIFINYEHFTNQEIKGNGLLTSEKNSVISYSFDIPVNSQYAVFSPDIKNYPDDDCWILTLTPSINTKLIWKKVERTYNSTGVPSTLHVFTQQLSLAQVSKKAQNLEITFSASEVVNKNIAKAKVFITLQRNGKVLYTLSSVNIGGTEKESYTLSYTIPNDYAGILDKCDLHAYICAGNIKTCIETQSNSVPLGIPNLTTRIEDSTITADFSLNSADGYYYNDGGEDKYIAENTVPYQTKDSLSKSIKVAPAFITDKGTIKGLFSESKALFAEAFYADINSLKYYKTTTLGVVDIPIGTNFFKTPPTANIAVAPFSINASKFSIDCSKEFTNGALRSFIEELFKDTCKVSPLGYYKICDYIARISPCAYADRLFYYCRAEKDGHSNELLPGFSLKIEAQYFNKQTASEIGDDNGFIKGAESEYTLSYNGENLEFNSCFDYISGSWTVGESANDFGGLVDTFISPFRSPYYRLVYPSAYYSSTHYSAASAANNMSIYPMTPVQIVGEDLNPIIFRGRTTITTEITITVNGQQLKVPLGTTIGSLKARYGGGKFSMSRQSGFGYSLPVHFLENILDNSEFERNFFLLAGDAITIA